MFLVELAGSGTSTWWNDDKVKEAAAVYLIIGIRVKNRHIEFLFKIGEILMFDIVKKYYSKGNARAYEDTRASGGKWAFENDTLENTLRELREEISSIIDMPVGTGRFLPFYQSEMKNQQVVGYDLSNDMLMEADKKLNRSAKNVTLLQLDIFKDSIQNKSDMVVCYRFVNLLPWEASKVALQKLLDYSRKYVLLCIRLVDDDYTGDEQIQGKIYLHRRSDFNALLADSGFQVHKDHYYKDSKGGDYHIYLLKKKAYLTSCRINKNHRIIFEGADAHKTKTYQCHNAGHAQFIEQISGLADIADLFPEVIKVESEFLTAQWVESLGHPSDASELVTLMMRLYACNIELDSHFDYVKDLIIPRFKKAIPLIGEQNYNRIVERLQRNSQNYESRLSNPDITLANVIRSKQNCPVIIDNELMCKTRFHRIDILNLLRNTPPAQKKDVLRAFLEQEKLQPSEFEKEFDYLSDLWVAREAGSTLLKLNLDACENLLSKFNNGEWILPFERSDIST
jgi:hypothetical protein